MITSKHLPIYEVFLQTKGRLTNLEIAKILYGDTRVDSMTNSQKKALTAPIVRIRKRLMDSGFLSPDPFQLYREELIKLLETKLEHGMTNLQIAEQFGLKKQQIDNLARQIKKEKKSED